MADDFQLKWDATNQQLYGEDPSNGNRIAIPFDSVETDQLQNGVAGPNNTITRIFGERIESQSPSGVSTVGFTTDIGSDYDAYVFELSNFVPSTNSSDLQLQISQDGGSSWDSGSSDYRWGYERVDDGGTTATKNGGGDSVIQLADAVGNESSEALNGTVKLWAPSSSRKTHFTYDISYNLDSGIVARVTGSGDRHTSATIDGVRFQFSSGDISQGEIDLLGVMK